MFSAFNRAGAALNRLGDDLLPLLARFVFAAVLLMYFINSGLTKLGDGFAGLWTPSLGAYAQIFPKKMEAVGFDVSQMGQFEYLVVLAGTWGEFILPVLIVVGLLTRLAAFGMIVFVIMQSLTDIYGHGAALGAWFDRLSDGVIIDQRAFWMLAFMVLVLKGGGWLSLDRLAFSGRAGDPATGP